MKPFEITENIHWVGALHPDLRTFDILMHTKNGTTYNSYLIKDEKNAVIDTVKNKFKSTFFENIQEHIDLKDLDYIIIQHNEPDHSGSLVELLEHAPNAKVVCAQVARKYVENITNRELDILTVKQGDTLDLGSRTLTFIMSPFLHWPDTMMTFSEKDEILFSCDVFANHFCDSHMVDEAIERNYWPDFEYYFKIIFRPYRKHIRKMLQKIDGLKISKIAPSHGPVLQDRLNRYIDAYQIWSQELPPNDPKKILIYYATAHGNTAVLAKTICDTLRNDGFQVSYFDITEININEHLDRIEAADALFIGSPTINNDAVKPVWDLLSSFATLELKNKIAASFGSMGWSGEAVSFIDQRLKDLNFKVPAQGFTCKLVPGQGELELCQEFAQKIAGEF
jgi:flavorubredoxin